MQTRTYEITFAGQVTTRCVRPAGPLFMLVFMLLHQRCMRDLIYVPLRCAPLSGGQLR
jgi:hypothetical protein